MIKARSASSWWISARMSRADCLRREVVPAGARLAVAAKVDRRHPEADLHQPWHEEPVFLSEIAEAGYADDQRALAFHLVREPPALAVQPRSSAWLLLPVGFQFGRPRHSWRGLRRGSRSRACAPLAGPRHAARRRPRRHRRCAAPGSGDVSASRTESTRPRNWTSPSCTLNSRASGQFSAASASSRISRSRSSSSRAKAPTRS